MGDIFHGNRFVCPAARSCCQLFLFKQLPSSLTLAQAKAEASGSTTGTTYQQGLVGGEVAPKTRPRYLICMALGGMKVPSCVKWFVTRVGETLLIYSNHFVTLISLDKGVLRFFLLCTNSNHNSDTLRLLWLFGLVLVSVTATEICLARRIPFHFIHLLHHNTHLWALILSVGANMPVPHVGRN